MSLLRSLSAVRRSVAFAPLVAIAVPLAGVAALTLPVAGCDCAGVGIMQLRPGSDVNTTVGGTFTAELWEGGTCQNEPLQKRTVRWGTPDSLVVRVDSLTGQVRALAVGDATVWSRTPGLPPGAREAGIKVHVR